MHWRIKACVQKSLGVLPGGAAVHGQLQRRLGGLRRFDEELASKVVDWTLMVGHLRAAGTGVEDARLLEIGTGWYPTFPLACYLAGAAHVLTYDLHRHLDAALLARCADGLGEHLEAIAAASGTPAGEVRYRHRRLRAALGRPRGDLGLALAAATSGIVVYRAPADATRTGLTPGAVDVVFSNSVLEHVPPAVIDGLYAEARRVLAPGGLMFHSVNCGDHYAYVDRRISQLHYLRYSDEAWSRWNNAFLYQNRLRAHELVARARAAGFDIVIDTTEAKPERLRQLEEVPVHPQFAHLSPEQLCVTTVDFVGRPHAAEARDEAPLTARGGG